VLVSLNPGPQLIGEEILSDSSPRAGNLDGLFNNDLLMHVHLHRKIYIHQRVWGFYCCFFRLSVRHKTQQKIRLLINEPKQKRNRSRREH
jgi:hypothetical protein